MGSKSYGGLPKGVKNTFVYHSKGGEWTYTIEWENKNSETCCGFSSRTAAIKARRDYFKELNNDKNS